MQWEEGNTFMIQNSVFELKNIDITLSLLLIIVTELIVLLVPETKLLSLSSYDSHFSFNRICFEISTTLIEACFTGK